jgi:hypothetical protein
MYSWPDQSRSWYSAKIPFLPSHVNAQTDKKPLFYAAFRHLRVRTLVTLRSFSSKRIAGIFFLQKLLHYFARIAGHFLTSA